MSDLLWVMEHVTTFIPFTNCEVTFAVNEFQLILML